MRLPCYENLLRRLDQAVLRYDARGTVTDANPAAERLLGREAAELVGRTLLELGASAEDLPRWLATTGDAPLEVALRASDGRAVAMHVTIGEIESDGAPCFAALAVDASVADRAALAARESELLEATLDAVVDAIVAAGPDGVVFGINPAALAATGYTMETIRGATLDDVLRLEDEATGAARPFPLREVMAAGSPYERRTGLLLRGPDGEARPIDLRASPIRDRAGGLTGVVIVFHTTAEERQASAALERSQRELYQLIERNPDGMALHREGRLVFVNRAWSRALRYAEPALLVGRALGDLVSPDQLDELITWMSDWQVGAEGPPPTEFRFTRADGAETTLELAPVERVQFEGHPASLLVARDVSARKRVHTQLMRADRMASLGTLAAGVAHEINNPLTYILANLDLMGEIVAEVSDPRLDEFGALLAETTEGVGRVRDTVRNLRAFARPDADRTAAVAADVQAVLDTALGLTRSETRRHAEVVCDLQPVPAVALSGAELSQVIVDLVLNAASAIPPGNATAHAITVRSRLGADGAVIIEVSDTGHGVAPDMRERIFDPFFTTRPTGEGTGLGLAICHGIVTAAGGRIELESELGVGSTFRLILPAAADPARAPAAEGDSSGAAQRRLHILVVDDEPSIGRALRRRLRAHDVDLVHSGNQAIDRLSAGVEYDLIFCDLMMPDLTGMAIYDRISRSNPSVADRIVFMTGGAYTREAQEFLQTVSNHHVAKPFDFDVINAVIAELTTIR